MKGKIVIILFSLFFYCIKSDAQVGLKGNEASIYTSGELSMNPNQVFLADLDANDSFINSVSIFNCTDKIMRADIETALGVTGAHFIPSGNSITLSLVSERFNQITLTSNGTGNALIQGIRDNRDARTKGTVLSTINAINCGIDAGGTGNADTTIVNFPAYQGIQLANQLRKEVGQGTYTLATNTYWVYVRNAGFTNITVNGETVSPNGVWQCQNQINQVNSTQDFCGETNIIIPINGFAWYSMSNP